MRRTSKKFRRPRFRLPSAAISAFCLLLALAPAALAAEDWDDLEPNRYYGSEREERMRINALVVEEENWADHYSLSILFGLFRYTDYPQFQETAWFPFYSNLTSRTDGRRRRHVLPLFFWRTDGERSFLLTPLTLHFLSPERSDHHFLLLGYLSSAGTESKQALFPLFMHISDPARQSETWLLLPVFAYDRENADVFSFLSPLFYLNRDAAADEWTVLAPGLYRASRGEDRAATLVGPVWRSRDDAADEGAFHIFPLLFSGRERDEGYLTIAPLFNYSYAADREFTIRSPVFYMDRNRAKDTTTILAPGFYRSSRGEERADTLVGPVWRSRDDVADETSFHILPLLFSGRDSNSGYFTLAPLFSYNYADERGFTWLSPLFYMNRNRQNDASTVLAPGFYRSSVGETRADTLIGPFWRSRDETAETRSFFALPLYYYFSDPAEWSATLLPLFYLRRNTTIEDTTLLAGPVYYSARTSPDGDRRERTWFALAAWDDSTEQKNGAAVKRERWHINPLLYYHSNVAVNRTELDYSLRLFFPIIPIFYRHADTDEGVSQLVLNTYYDTKPDESLDRFWFMPLVFYRSDRYLHVAPLYFQPYNTPARQLSFSPLHYYSRRDEDYRLITPVYYRSEETAKESSVEHILPLFYSWESRESVGDLLLPVYLRYEDRSRYIRITAVGLSLREQTGLFIPGGGRNTKNEWYYDQDVALFYSLFRFSSRVTFQRPADATAPAPETGPALFEAPDFDGEVIGPVKPNTPYDQKRADGAPGLARRTEFNRDNSRQFLGLTLLFGLWAYERADEQRHLRVLPLSWFTWEEGSEDGIFFAPGAFLHYHRDELEYTAIFPAFIPLYGKQRSGESFVESWLAIGFLREYDAEADQREYSVLWPLANFYSSPARSGGRLLPLFHYRRETTPAGETARLITPVYYSSQAPADCGVETRRVSPLFFYAACDAAPSAENASETERWSLLGPGFYAARKDGETHGNALLLLDWKNEPDRFRFWFFPVFSFATGRDGYFWLAPFYLSSSGDSGESTFALPPAYYQSESRTGKDVTFTSLSLLHYYTSETDADSSTAPARERTLFGPLYYWSQSNRTDDERETHLNVALLMDYRSVSGADAWTRFQIFPAFGFRTGAHAWNYLGPIYYSPDGPESWTFHIMPALWSWKQEHSFTMFLAGLYIRSAPDSSRQNFLYLFDRERYGDQVSYGLVFDALYYERREGRTKFELLNGWGASLNLEPGGRYLSVLWLYDEARADYRHSSFVPIWYYERRGASTEWWALPALSFGQYRRGEEETWLALGALYQRSLDEDAGEASRRILAGILYTDVQEAERGYRSRGSLWGLLWDYQTEQTTDFQKISVLKLLYSRTRYEGRVTHRVLGVRVSETDAQE